MIKIIDMVRDFTDWPWPRYKKEWDFSWEEFYEKFFKNDFEKFSLIMINLDWTLDYPSSFLSEAFWPIYKEFWECWRNKIKFISEEDPTLPEFIYFLAKKYAFGEKFWK